jgi:hypothetical protein
MGIQTSVNFVQGFGVPGELYDNGTVRCEPFSLLSADPTTNIFGTAFTILSEGVAQSGNPLGTAVFAGIMANPKAVKSVGIIGNPLAPTLTVPNNVIVEMLNMGCVIVQLPAAAAIGDLVLYDNITGALETVAPGTALPVGKSSAYAVVDRYTVSGAGLAVIRLTTTPEIPV